MKRVRLETVASGPLEIPTMIGTTVPRAYTRTEIDRVERLVGGLKLLRVPRDDSMDFVAWRAGAKPSKRPWVPRHTLQFQNFHRTSKIWPYWHPHGP